jgi:hypothetical protein
MRKSSITLVALIGVFVMLAFTAVAGAASPHFIGTPKATASANTLTVTFKAAGLGNAAGATFNLAGDVQVSSRCYNRGGNKPQADNKQETLSVNQTKAFDVTNGQTTGTFTVSPLSTLTRPCASGAE